MRSLSKISMEFRFQRGLGTNRVHRPRTVHLSLDTFIYTVACLPLHFTSSEEWPRLRDMIKFRIQSNIEVFLSDPNLSKPRPLPPFTYRPATNGGLKFPPVQPRARNPDNPMEPPKSFMNRTEAEEMKASIFQQLHEFEGNPPFTIQRLCELCVRPKEQYKSVGKYLRAVEKTLLVTSSWNSFPISTESESTSTATTSLLFPGSSSVPTTPIFSPIPFLHDDARTRSRSPPPLTLHEVKAEPRALGLVDELDDPRPGHMSDYPMALSSTMSSSGSLQDRFVRAQDGERESKRQKTEQEDDVTMDESDDKENQG